MDAAQPGGPMGPGHSISPRADRLNLEEAAAALPDFARSLGLPVPSEATMATLWQILDALPPGLGLPRLATDTEGCVLMRWGGPAALAATVEGVTVHATVRPGSASTHVEAFAWTGSWPDAVLAAGRTSASG